jgi:hypothetical protein
VRAWAQQNGQEFLQLLPSATKTIAAFKTAAGVVALETANRVRTLPDVVSAEPNWWAEKWKGSLELKVVTPNEAKQNQSAREAMSRRFSEP